MYNHPWNPLLRTIQGRPMFLPDDNYLSFHTGERWLRSHPVKFQLNVRHISFGRGNYTNFMLNFLFKTRPMAVPIFLQMD